MLSSDISHLIVQGFKGCLGKGPTLIKVNVSENIIFVDLKGSLTPLEQTLLKRSSDNKSLIKEIRKQINECVIDYFRNEMQSMISTPDFQINSFTFDIDYDNDRLILVLICNKHLNIKE